MLKNNQNPAPALPLYMHHETPKTPEFQEIYNFAETCQSKFHARFEEYRKSCGVRVEANPTDPNICDIVFSVVYEELIKNK